MVRERLSKFIIKILRHHETPDLIRAADHISPELSCFQFIHFRDALDKWFQSSGERHVHYPSLPRNYAYDMLPGLIDGWGKNDPQVDHVHPSKVLGCSWKGHSEPNDPFEKLEKINAWDNSTDAAQYTRIGNLPLYIAHEGKNRVELFQRYNKKIRAEVSSANLRAGIEIGHDDKQTIWFARWPQQNDPYSPIQEIAAIPFPTVALPIYRALGTSYVQKPIKLEFNSPQYLYDKAIKSLAAGYALP